MRHIPINSSNLRSVGYDGSTLEIRFHSGGNYQYFDVPNTIYNELMSAALSGEYFHANIENNYRCKKIQ